MFNFFPLGFSNWKWLAAVRWKFHFTGSDSVSCRPWKMLNIKKEKNTENCTKTKTQKHRPLGTQWLSVGPLTGQEMCTELFTEGLIIPNPSTIFNSNTSTTAWSNARWAPSPHSTTDQPLLRREQATSCWQAPALNHLASCWTQQGNLAVRTSLVLLGWVWRIWSENGHVTCKVWMSWDRLGRGSDVTLRAQISIFLIERIQSTNPSSSDKLQSWLWPNYQHIQRTPERDLPSFSLNSNDFRALGSSPCQFYLEVRFEFMVI